MNVKNIVLSSDNHYAQHLGVTIMSLLKNNSNETFKLFIFGNDISELNKRYLSKIIEPFRCEMEYINFDSKIFENMNIGRLSIATYFRLLMPVHINVDKLLYLDVDIIVNKPINELYDIDLKNHYVAAVEDVWTSKEYCNKLGMDSDAKYFNSGVLLVNLKKWKEENLFNKFIEYQKNSTFLLEAHDQDILNAIFNGNWKRLPLKFNQYGKNPDLECKKFLNFFTSEEILEAQKDPIIIHYIGGRKPWHYRNEHIKKELYWKYLMLTPYKDYKPKDKTIRNIISKNTPKIIRNPKRYFKSILLKNNKC